MPIPTKAEFESHLKELEKAIERARVVLAHGDRSPANSVPQSSTENKSGKNK